MSYKAALFDLDGTLLDTLSDLWRAVNAALTEEGLPERTKAEVRAALGNGYVALISALVPEDTDDKTKERVLKNFQTIYQAHATDTTAPYPGILNLLQRLKETEVKLAVISNKGNKAVQALIPNYFPDTFDLTIGEQAGIRRKPAPDMLNYAIETLKLQKEEVVYIGDSEVDVESAKNAGTALIAVSWGFRDKAELVAAGATRIVDTTEELTDAIIIKS